MSEGHEYWLMQQKERLESELAQAQQQISELRQELSKAHSMLHIAQQAADTSRDNKIWDRLVINEQMQKQIEQLQQQISELEQELKAWNTLGSKKVIPAIAQLQSTVRRYREALVDLLDTLGAHTLPASDDVGSYHLVNAGEIDQAIERAQAALTESSNSPQQVETRDTTAREGGE